MKKLIQLKVDETVFNRLQEVAEAENRAITNLIKHIINKFLNGIKTQDTK